MADHIGGDERVKALAVLRRPEKVTAGDVVEAGVAAASGATSTHGGPATYVLVAATDKNVHIWDVNGFEITGRVASWPLGQARLRLKRGLLGSRLLAGHQQVFAVPLGGRGDAQRVIAAVSGR